MKCNLYNLRRTSPILFIALGLGCLSSSVSAQEHTGWISFPSDKASLGEIRDQQRVVDLAIKGNIKALRKLILRSEAQRTGVREPEHLELLRHATGALSRSSKLGPEVNALLEEWISILSGKIGQMPANQQVATLFTMTTAGVFSIVQRTGSDFTLVMHLLDTEKLLRHEEKTLKDFVPPPPVDLTKFDWSGQIVFSGMSPEMIKNPELKQAYASSLERRSAILRNSSSQRLNERNQFVFYSVARTLVDRITLQDATRRQSLETLLQGKHVEESLVLQLLSRKLQPHSR